MERLMMGNNIELIKYLKEHFAHVPLESPLFYNAPIGIRFELGVPYRGIDDPAYFTNICMRSSMIFREVFGSDEEMFVVVKNYRSIEPYYCYNQGEDIFPKYIKNKKLINQVSTIEIERHFEENGDLSGISYLHSLLCKREDLDYVGILKAKSHQDFAIEPYVSDAVFFINTQRHIIFYMYDDRGMDLVAEKKESIWPVYIKYNDWILNYDRKRIDSIFKD